MLPSKLNLLKDIRIIKLSLTAIQDNHDNDCFFLFYITNVENFQ